MQEETYMMQEEEVVAGKHSVTEALKSGRTINKIWIAENAQKHLTLPIIAEAKKLGIVIQHVDKRKLDQMVPESSIKAWLPRRHPTLMWKWTIC